MLFFFDLLFQLCWLGWKQVRQTVGREEAAVTEVGNEENHDGGSWREG